VTKVSEMGPWLGVSGIEANITLRTELSELPALLKERILNLKLLPFPVRPLIVYWRSDGLF